MKTYFLDTTDGVKHELPVILHANGAVSDFRPPDDRFPIPRGDDAAEAVSGEIPLVPWKDIVMDPLPGSGEYNYRASLIAQRKITGDVVIRYKGTTNQTR